MHVQVGDRVAVDLIVHLRGPVQRRQHARHSHRLAPEPDHLHVRQLKRFFDVALGNHACGGVFLQQISGKCRGDLPLAIERDVQGKIYTDGSRNFANIEAVNLLRANNNADLSTSVSDSPDPVNAGHVVTYHMHIQNGGPLDASQPRLTAPIPSGTKLVGAAQTDGSAFHCTSDGTTVTCAAASLASGGSAAVDMAVKTARSQQGTIALHASASSSTSDADRSNDASSETTTITPAPTGVTIGRTVTKRRSGSITVAIGCKGFPAHTCPVTVTVSFRPPHDDLAPITARKTIKAGRRSIVFVIGSRSERRRIKRIGRLPVHVAVTNRNGSGATRDATASGP